MPDRTIKCIDCGTDFPFTEREQEWYREKGLTHEPRRCKACRSSRKGGSGGASGGPPADRRPAPDRAPSPPPSAPRPPGDRPRRPPARQREMFQVQCSTCGKPTEIPFRPDPTRPVYCRDCYLARGKKR